MRLKLAKPLFLVMAGIFIISLSYALNSSPEGKFTVEPDEVWINFTTDAGLGRYSFNITINWTEGYEANISIGNYNLSGILIHSYLKDGNVSDWGKCYFGSDESEQNEAPCLLLKIIPSNRSNFSSNTAKNFTLLVENLTTAFKWPGRYVTRIGLPIWEENKTHPENLTLKVVVDIPINFTYFNSRYVQVGKYFYKIPQMGTERQEVNAVIKASNTGKNDTHVYYFNVSEIENATAIFFNLTGSDYVGAYLFNQSDELLAFTTSSFKYLFPVGEAIYRLKQEDGNIFKLVIYGNSSNEITYASVLGITTLNISPYEVKKEINLSEGETNVSGTLLLENKGKYNYTNVIEEKSVYYYYHFSGSGNRTFEILVPPEAKNITAYVFWESNGNYSVEILNQTGEMVSLPCIQEVKYGDVLNVTRYAYAEVNLSDSVLTPGIWKVRVRNFSAVTPPYDLYVFIGVPLSFRTNYTSTELMQYGMENSSKAINYSITLSNTSIPGRYYALLTYREPKGAGIFAEIKFNVSAPSVTLNDTFLQEKTVEMKQNLYLNYTFNVSFVLRNVGNENITNASVKFTNLTKGGSYVNITGIYLDGKTVGEKFNLTTGGEHVLKVEISIKYPNASAEGIHQGRVTLNFSSSGKETRPYGAINLTLKLNLSKSLIANITSSYPSIDTSVIRNISINFSAFFINGTEIKDVYAIRLPDILSLNLTHMNYTSRKYSTEESGNRRINVSALVAGAEQLYSLEYKKHVINFTLPEQIPGGYYLLEFRFRHNSTPLYGYASKILAFAGEAMHFSVDSFPTSMQNGTYYWLNLTLRNYGLNASEIGIKIDDTNNKISEFDEQGSTCQILTSNQHEGEYYSANFSVTPQSSCKLSIKIKTSSSAGSSTLKITPISGLWLVGERSIDFSVSAPSGGDEEENPPSTPPQQQSQPPQQEEPPEEGNQTQNVTFVPDMKIISYPQTISVVEGEEKAISISVKNTGNLTLHDIEIKVEKISSEWFTLPGRFNLTPDTAKTLSVTIKVPLNTPLGEHKFEWKVTCKENVVRTAQSTLTVLPSEERKFSLENEFKILNETYHNISLVYMRCKNEYGISNETLEGTLQSIGLLLNEIKTSLEESNYAGVESSLDAVKKLLQEAKLYVEEIRERGEKAKAGNLLKMIGIVIIIVVAGFLVYLLLPPPHGYEPERGYRFVPKHHRGRPRLKKIVDELKEIYEKLRKKKQAGSNEHGGS